MTKETPSDALMSEEGRRFVDEKYDEDRAMERLEDYETDGQPVEDDPVGETRK